MTVRTQSTTVSVYNPFTDSYEDLFCEADFHYDKHKLDSVEITKLITDSDVNMRNYLHPEEIEKLEQKILEREA